MEVFEEIKKVFRNILNRLEEKEGVNLYFENKQENSLSVAVIFPASLNDAVTKQLSQITLFINNKYQNELKNIIVTEEKKKGKDKFGVNYEIIKNKN